MWSLELATIQDFFVFKHRVLFLEHNVSGLNLMERMERGSFLIANTRVRSLLLQAIVYHNLDR